MTLFFALPTLVVGLLVFVWRPSIGLLAIIAGGLWNVMDYLPDHAITDPYAVGSLVFNLADVAILTGLSLITAEKLHQKQVLHRKLGKSQRK